MSTQTGISVSPALADAFSQAVINGDVRVIKASIESESIVPSASLPPTEGSSFHDDFGLVPDLLEDDKPAYILYRLDETTAGGEYGWLFAAYVPDNAKVRDKMLYAATRATLTKQLGDSKFTDTLFATTKSELTKEGYSSHIEHSKSSNPLTAAEQELATIKAAEQIEIRGTDQRQTHFGDVAGGGSEGGGGGGGMPWEEGVEESVKRVWEEGGVAYLTLDVQKETVILAEGGYNPEASSLSLPPDTPTYTFLRLDHEFQGQQESPLVFIYCCPSTSPVRSRLIFSANARSVSMGAERRFQSSSSGPFKLSKKIESSTPEEITRDFVLSELHPTDGGGIGGESRNGSGNGGATAPVKKETGFAKPKRPGGRR